MVDVVAVLARLGVDDHTIDQILRVNPAQFFSLSEMAA